MPSFWSRLVTAIRTGVQTFREEATIPDERRDWHKYEHRIIRYALKEGMYNNTVYRDIETYALMLKKSYHLYKHIQGIHNPEKRLCRAYANKTLGGSLDWEGLQSGAIQVVNANDAHIQALLQVFRWSKWGQNKTLFGRQTAKLGDCGLWIVDDPLRKKVRMEILHPAKIKDADFDEVGNVKAAVIEYEREWEDPDTGKSQDVIYRMVVSKERFETFKDKEPYAWHGDQPAWDNDYGFVPLVIANFEDVGLNWGASASHGSLAKIHAVNDVASLLVDNIRKSIDTWWYVAGARSPNEIRAAMQLSDGTDTSDPSAQRDKGKFLYGPAGSQPHPMVFPLDVTAVASEIKDQLKELEKDMPILALQNIRDEGTQLSGVAIRNLYGDAVDDVNEAAGNLFDAQIRATQMAITIGGFRGYDGFRSFGLESYDRGDLDYYFKEPELFDDELTPKEQIEVMQNLPENTAVARYILEKLLEIPTDTVNDIIDAETETQERQARAAARGLAEKLFGPQDDDDEEIIDSTANTPALTAPGTTSATNGNRGN